MKTVKRLAGGVVMILIGLSVASGQDIAESIEDGISIPGDQISADSVAGSAAEGIGEEESSASLPEAVSEDQTYEEGVRFVSTPSPYTELRQKAIGGTTALLLGMGVDITAAMLALADPPREDGEAIPYLIVSLGVGACMMSSVPATCAQASGAADAFGQNHGYGRTNPAWKYYGAGWFFCATGEVVGLVATLGESAPAGWIASAFSVTGGVIWSIACLRSIAFIKELEALDVGGEAQSQRMSLSLTPLVGLQGQVGVGLVGRF